MGLAVYTSTGAMLTDVSASAAYVTTLPSSPYDGQTVVYAADATNGVMWLLRYRSAATGSYKWEFVGGGSLSFLDGSNVSAALTANTWSNISTAQKITVPLAGDYIVSYTTQTFRSQGQQTVYTGVKVDTTEPTQDVNTTYANTAADIWAQHAGMHRFNGIGANKDFTVRYRAVNNMTINRLATNMLATPVRVG